MEWIVFALIAAITAAIVTTLSKAALKDIDATTAFAIQSVLILIVSWCAVFVLGKNYRNRKNYRQSMAVLSTGRNYYCCILIVFISRPQTR